MWRVETDGASRGNPGPAGIGYRIIDPTGRVVAEVSENIGIATNNVAEYTALVRALRQAARLGADAVEVLTDSELMARQLNGQYRVRSLDLLPLYTAARRLLGRFRGVTVRHVPRERNARADALASRAAGGKVAGGLDAGPDADRERESAGRSPAQGGDAVPEESPNSAGQGAG